MLRHVRTTDMDIHLRVSKVDLHDESHSDTCGKGETGCDDDCQPISLAGTAFSKGVFSGLPQGYKIIASQVRSWRGETSEASRFQKQIWIWDKKHPTEVSQVRAGY